MTLEWIHIVVVIAMISVFSSLLILFLRRLCIRTEKPQSNFASRTVFPTANERFASRIAKLQQASDIKRRVNANSFYVPRRGNSGSSGGIPAKLGLFTWSDHPNLITDAVENGWSSFGFEILPSPPPLSAGLLGICAMTVNHGESDTEITWEISNNSTESMQQIKFNRGYNNLNSNHYSTVQAALPLPGPQLGNSAFPREAYFEIQILEIGGGGFGGDDVEGEKIKLINENKGFLTNKEGQIAMSEKDCDGEVEEILFCLGLTANFNGISDPTKLPGSSHGSICFNSNGSVFLDGIKLAFETEKHDWGKTDKVIGCGFDPRKKTVFFTVDSNLVHVINCKTEEFETPIYPIMASNIEATVLVNFGQSPFSYGPANSRRTVNPCFIGSVVRTSSTTNMAGFEDSGDLFSMGIDPQYLSQLGYNEDYHSRHSSGILGRKPEDGDHSDADLFEIVLERSGRSYQARK